MSTESRKSWLHEPLLHFLVIGAALFLVFGLWGTNAEAPATQPEIVVTQGKIRQLEVTFLRTWQRPPTAAELQGLIEDHVTEEILYREALALGLGEDDTIVRRRLRQKMDFLLDDLGAGPAPSDDELQAYLDAHPDDFRAAPSFSFRHVFVSPEDHGAETAREAERLLAKLRRSPGNWSALGSDPLVLDSEFEDIPSRGVSALFGGSLAEELAKQPVGEWSGPLASGFGLHLVFIETRGDAPEPTLETVQVQVERELQRETREARTVEALRAMREQYRIVIEAAEAPTPESVGQ